MKYKIDLIVELNADLLEGPVYNSQTKTLYFVSIFDFRVYRYQLMNTLLDFIQLNSPTSCVFLSKNFGVVAATKSGFYKLNFDTGTAVKIFEIEIDNYLRFNDGTLDSYGRFIIGTMGYPDVVDKAGALLSFDGSVVKELIKNVTISNGVVFSHDSKTMYFIDTPTKCIARYDYNLETGECKFRDNFINFVGIGVPDGMDIDNSGNLWVAEWGGYKVSIWDSITGKMKGEISLPQAFVTSVCLAENNTIYVTTAKNVENGKVSGGSLFKVILS